jgi:hypothetical protein
MLTTAMLFLLAQSPEPMRRQSLEREIERLDDSRPSTRLYPPAGLLTGAGYVALVVGLLSGIHSSPPTSCVLLCYPEFSYQLSDPSVAIVALGTGR